MPARRSTAETIHGLPASLHDAHLAYQRYLKSERNLSPATVAAYTADVASLLEHLARLHPDEHTSVTDLDLTDAAQLAGQAARDRFRAKRHWRAGPLPLARSPRGPSVPVAPRVTPAPG